MAGLRSPAPVGPVPEVAALVRDLVNTTDRETGTDDLTTPAALAAFLRQRAGLAASARATADDLDLALALRAGLRRALEVNHDGGATALPDLDAALTALPLVVRWDRGAPVLDVDGSGVRAALARVAAAVAALAADGAWHRLKICSSDECAWAYYDHSKNRSRQWCEYGCGNRLKARAYRERARDGS